MIFWDETVDFNFFFAGNEVSLYTMDDRCFDLEVVCDTYISSPVTVWFRTIPFLSKLCQKTQYTVAPFHYVLGLEPSMHKISSSLVFQAQFHEEVSVKFLETVGRVMS